MVDFQVPIDRGMGKRRERKGVERSFLGRGTSACPIYHIGRVNGACSTKVPGDSPCWRVLFSLFLLSYLAVGDGENFWEISFVCPPPGVYSVLHGVLT